MHRRTILKGAGAGAAALLLAPMLSRAGSAEATAARLAELERAHGGRLGVAMLDTGSGEHAAYRGNERFLMCSTFKVLAVAAVLARVDQRKEQLDRRIVVGKDDLLSYAPVTRQHVGALGMTVSELCQAAITVSDNTAANLLLASLGGPAELTAFMRALGDPVTRLDRFEPDLNIGRPGDVRDTTTPSAMLGSLKKLLLGEALSADSRALLTQWMRNCSTGKTKIRAGVPSNWQVGDKTGSGAQGESNDIAILWPPQRKPLLVAAYYVGSGIDRATSDVVLAEVGRIAAG